LAAKREAYDGFSPAGLAEEEFSGNAGPTSGSVNDAKALAPGGDGSPIERMIAALFPELLAVGGLQLAGRELAAALAAMADENGEPYYFLSLNDSPGEQEAAVGNLCFRFRGFGRQKLRFVRAALKTARLRPRCVFASHPNLAPVATAMRIAGKRPLVIIGTHGIEVWRPLPFLRRRALRAADIVLAPSSDTARKLAQIQFIPEGKIHRLPWPLDPEFLALAASAENLPLPVGFPHGQIVLTVGRWAASERYKGADLLIRAVASLAAEFRELQLVLAGSGDDLPRLQQLARETDIPSRIHFLTHFSRQELASCYARADIFALPSSGEGFGLVFLEAMALNKPVIGASLGGIPDIVTNGETGCLIDPKDSTSLERGLRTLLSDASLRMRMGQQAGKVVRDRFSFSRFQHGVAEIFSNTFPD
jgi:phosphatidyl-myo-inositol dimannoside synthase